MTWTRARERWLVVVLFAVGMAWVEAASVYYLRAMIGRIDPYQPDPLPIRAGFTEVELVREAATLVMLLATGMLAGRTWRARLGYSAIAFGVWDIFYYVFLRMMSGWPGSVLAWDILFLLPLPWWGPVLAPVSIAALMIAWGTFETQLARRSEPGRSGARVWAACLLGTVLALYVFMADAVQVVHRGMDATRDVLPSEFNWLLFGLAFALMALPVAETGWRARSARSSP